MINTQNFIITIACACACMTAVGSAATVNADQAEKRASELLKQMTLEEKIDYIGGLGISIRAIPRLGIPEIVMSDGPMAAGVTVKRRRFQLGSLSRQPGTAPWQMRSGSALGRECRARGVHIILAPAVNIYRSPLCGRNFEYMGEDPYLASHMVVRSLTASNRRKSLQQSSILPATPGMGP